VLLGAPAEANVHLCLLPGVSRQRRALRFTYSPTNRKGLQDDQDKCFINDIDVTHFPSRVNCLPGALMNPELPEVVGVAALTKPSDVNRVVSNQNAPM